MSGTAVESEHGCWITEDPPKVIEYSPEVLAEVDRAVIEGFNRFRRGGIEVGGVLFGVISDEKVTILASRPISCEYAFGPGFVFSENDHSGLTELLKASRADKALLGLVPVGWFHSHSHTHSEINLSPQDLEIFDRHFPESWQISLVLKPETFAPTKAGFFFRERDGSIRVESSYREFTLRPAAEKMQALLRPSGPPIEVPKPVVPPPVRQADLARKPVSSAYPTSLSIALLGICLLLVRSWPRSPNSFSLEVAGKDDQVRIAWDRASKAIRKAPGALIEISDDGQKRRIELDKESLLTGAVVYTRRSENVVIRMTAGDAEETATFMGKPVGRAGIEQADRAAESELREQISQLEQVVDQLKKKRAPEKVNARIRPTGVARPPVEEPWAPLRSARPVPLIPLLTSPAVGMGSDLTTPPQLIGSLAQPVPVPVSNKAKSGTLTWIGRLPKNGIRKITAVIHRREP